MLDSIPVSCKSLSTYYHVNGKRLEEQYRNHLSDFLTWNQLDHADQWLLFKQNIGSHLSIDEVALTQGELYTVITNKAAKGKQGSLVAIVATTQSDRVIEVLRKIPSKDRYLVEEITLDMASTMKKIARKAFPKATQVTDRFHVEKLAYMMRYKRLEYSIDGKLLNKKITK